MDGIRSKERQAILRSARDSIATGDYGTYKERVDKVRDRLRDRVDVEIILARIETMERC